MAKNFKYNTSSSGFICTDKCSYTLINERKIGSAACRYECNIPCIIHPTDDLISCPKIIYRHADGRVIMRKPKK